MKNLYLKLLVSIIIFIGLISAALSAEEKAGKWAGVDESVVEKFAEEHGRKAVSPLINTDGDLLLFVFLTAGAVGGFIGGYYWRVLISEKSSCKKGNEIEN